MEVVTKRLLHQQVKMLGYFWCHVHAWKCIPTAISSGVDISEAPGCHLLWLMSSQSWSQKLLQILVSHEHTAYLSTFSSPFFNLFKLRIISIILKPCKPHNFESHNSVMLTFTNIWGLQSNFAHCESFFQSNSPDIVRQTLFYVRQTWMTQLILAISLWKVILL